MKGKGRREIGRRRESEKQTDTQTDRERERQGGSEGGGREEGILSQEMTDSVSRRAN